MRVYNNQFRLWLTIAYYTFVTITVVSMYRGYSSNYFDIRLLYMKASVAHLECQNGKGLLCT